MDRSTVTNSTRFALEVKRYHTWPTIRTQTVGEHTAQIMRIYWEIFGEPSPAVWAEILWHDITEQWTGDIPFPMKTRYPTLKSSLSEIEKDARAAMQIPTAGVAANAADRARIKICDLLEMWEFGHEELAMGNAYAEPITVDIQAAVRERLQQFEPAERKRVEEWINARQY